MNKKGNYYIKLIILLGFINMSLKGLRLFTNPEGLSINEIQILSPLPYVFHNFAYYFRIISVITSSIISLLFFALIYKKTGKLIQAFGVGLAFAIEPWSFIHARYINFGVFFVLYLTIAFYFATNKKRKIIFFLLLTSGLIIKFSINKFFLSNQINELLSSLDLVTLFFTGDSMSTYLRIPLTGFFLFIDIPLFFLGCNFITTDYIWSKNIKSFMFILLLSFTYFFLNPQSIPSERLILLFTCMTIAIGIGYSVIIEKSMKHKTLLLFMIVIFVGNLIFYQELFYNHFDKKNSTEWGYAEKTLILYIQKHPEIKNIYITTKREQLFTYLQFFLPKIKYTKLTEDMINRTCNGGYNRCIIKEDELSLLGLKKEQIKIFFNNKGGLPEFFLL